MSMDGMLRRKEVLRVTGLSRSTLYAMISAGEFPTAVRLGRRAVGWREKDVAAWLESRPLTSESEWR